MTLKNCEKKDRKKQKKYLGIGGYSQLQGWLL